MQALELEPIGVFHTPYLQTKGMPIQPAGAAGVEGKVEVFDDYAEGLRDRVGFSHIIMLYHFHLSDGYDLTVAPLLDVQAHGLIATRALRRPNPIGPFIARLNHIAGNTLQISNID